MIWNSSFCWCPASKLKFCSKHICIRYRDFDYYDMGDFVYQTLRVIQIGLYAWRNRCAVNPPRESMAWMYMRVRVCMRFWDAVESRVIHALNRNRQLLNSADRWLPWIELRIPYWLNFRYELIQACMGFICLRVIWKSIKCFKTFSKIGNISPAAHHVCVGSSEILMSSNIIKPNVMKYRRSGVLSTCWFTI